jgi:hypothetical protein
LLLITQRGKRTSIDVLEFLGMGIAIGTALALLSGELLLHLVPSSLGWLIPSIVVAVLWLSRRGKVSAGSLPTLTHPVRTLTAFGISTVVGIISIALNLSRYPLTGVTRWSEYHVDMLYFEGLTHSLARFGPGDSIFMSGSDIRYHWFSYAWVGQLNDFAGAQSFAGLTRLLPLVALIGVASLATSWTARLTEVRWAPLLSGLLVVSGGFVGALFGTVLNFDSPSQSFSAVWLLGLMLVIWAYVTNRGRHWLLIPAAVLAVGVTGGKVSTGLLAVGAIAIAAGIGVVVKAGWWRRALVSAGVTALGAGVTYLVVLSGGVGTQDFHVLSWMARASTAQGLNPGVSASAVAVGTLGLVLAVIARWSGVALYFTSREQRRSLEAALSIGLVICGIVPLLLLSQGINEIWFAVSASAPLSVLSSAAIARSWNRIGHRGWLAAAVIVGGGLFVLCAAMWSQGEMGSVSWRAWGPYVVFAGACLVGLVAAVALRKSSQGVGIGLLVACSVLVTAAVPARILPDLGSYLPRIPLPSGVLEFQDSILKGSRVIDIPTVTTSPQDLTPIISTWTTSEVEAAEYLLARINDSDVIVTNETSGFLMPALVGHLTYLSGSRYQWVYGTGSSVEDLPARITASRQFVSANNRSTYADLCRAGVTWGWVNTTLDHAANWQPVADVAFANETVSVLRFNRTNLCSSSHVTAS